MAASLVSGKDSKPSVTNNSTNQALLDDVFLTASLSGVLFLPLTENAHRDVDELVIVTIRIPPQQRNVNIR